MRGLFADGFNSASHFTLGVIAARTYPVLGTLAFCVYQFAEREQVNTLIDLAEYAIGFVVGRAVP